MSERIPCKSSVASDSVAWSPAELPQLAACRDEHYLIQAAHVQKQVSDGVRVVATRPTQCRNCEKQGGCGLGLFGRWFARGEQTLLVRTTLSLPEGSWLWLGFPKTDFVRTVFMLYGLPVLLLLVGGLLGNAWGPAYWLADVKSGSGMIVGGLMGALLARFWARHRVASIPVTVLWPTSK